MRTPWLLLLITSISVYAQTPQELLRSAEDAYKNPTGFEIDGMGWGQPKGSSWRMGFSIKIVAAPVPLETPNAPASPGVLLSGPYDFTKTGAGVDEKPKPFFMPFAVMGGWSEIADNATSVKEIGSEQLPLNGGLVACPVLEVQYSPLPDGTERPIVKYSICSDKHLALKKVTVGPPGRLQTDPEALWTITLDTVRFHRPAPKWLLDQMNQPALSTRRGWQGKRAPAFKLADLDGREVEIGKPDGKMLLLDFWSTSCGPCLLEMPLIQQMAEEHRGDLIVWGISFDQPEHDKKWLSQHQRSFQTLTDSDFLASDLYKVRGIPAVVLIDGNSRIRNYWEGPVNKNDLEAALRRAATVR